MALFGPRQRPLAELVSKLANCNPFLPERRQLERQILGHEVREEETRDIWSNRPGYRESPDIEEIGDRVAALAGELRQAWVEGRASHTDADRSLYEDVAMFHLFHKYRGRLRETFQSKARVAYWEPFFDEWKHFFLPAATRGTAPAAQAAHVLACFFQIRRAFELIFQPIFGSSMPAARLRAAVWQSIFTHDLGRYRRTLYGRMDEIATLVIGPSGTGKELVARAIARSRYIPFDPDQQQFKEKSSEAFHPINLSELTPELIASELFGHRQGAFTDAREEHVGWLEHCQAGESIFLDEIGDLDEPLQVKLLRVMEYRIFRRVGETTDRRFAGKIIAATNRDLFTEIREGRFRQDFYYRLCSDIIHTPTLREQIDDKPEDLRSFVQHIADKVAGSDESEKLTDEVLRHIEGLEPNYPWPGNIRELEQCVRNVMIHKTYQPCRSTDMGSGGGDSFSRSLRDVLSRGPGCGLTADQLEGEYCRVVYAQTRDYKETGELLGLDWRTVKRKVRESGHEAAAPARTTPK